MGLLFVRLWHIPREDVVAGFGDEYVVFDAYADARAIFWGPWYCR